jgi:hypothetical protein
MQQLFRRIYNLHSLISYFISPIMKIRHYTLALAATMALNSVTFAGTTAKQAIATLRTSEGTNVASHIISLTGRFGQDQPQEWEILARQGQEYAMYIVDGKAVQSFSKVRPKTKTPVKLATNAIKIDSSSAFRIADKAAKKVSVGFESLSYDLKPRRDSSAPVWIVSLADSRGSTVGQIHIASDSGGILRTNWDRVQLNRPALRNAPSTGATRGILADRRGSTQTGTAADGIREGLASLRNVFRKGQVSKTDQNKSPQTTKTLPR